MSIIARPLSEISPATPLLISPSDPMIEVSGVLSSWLTVEMNSFFMRSIFLRSVMSRTMPVNMRFSPRFISLTASSSGNVPPSLRRPSTSRRTPMIPARPVSR